MQPEKILEHQIKDYCKTMRIDYIINKQQKKCKCGQWASIGSTKGIFDMTVFYHGRSLWIELKTKKGILSQDQQKFGDKLLDNDIISYVVRSLDDFIKVIEVNK